MLTVRQALELPALGPATLVAGRAGLDNRINWVHIVDIPDTSYEWKRKGVLLLTAGFGLKGSPARQSALVPKLVEEGFAGMALCVGYYFDSTPEVIRRHADDLGFPIIETPPDLLFIEITEAILERIINHQYALLQQSEQINAQLTELVLQGASLDRLASTLALILKRSITIEDTSFHILAAARHGHIDEARERSLDAGHTAQEVAQRLLDSGIYTKLLEHMEPVRVAPMPDLGMDMERIVAPIIVDREIYAHMWILAGEEPLTELDELAISHGATVAALILLKEQAVRKAEEALRGDFLERLLRGERGSPAFAEQAQRLSFRPEEPCQVMVVRTHSETGGTARTLSDYTDDWLRKRDLRPLLLWRDDRLVMVLESKHVGFGEQMARELYSTFSNPGQRLLIGVGRRRKAMSENGGGVRLSYEEASEAERIGGLLGQEEGVVAFDDLGILHWLYHMPPERWSGNRYLKHVETLAAYDARRGTALVETMETYLEHGGSLVDTAEALFIHRNTLLHRLERIEELCPVDLRDPSHRLNLHAAVKGYWLFRRDGS